MNRENIVKETEDFYGRCAEILGTEHEFRDCVPRPKMDRNGKMYTPATKATRWGGREPGNGRFQGFGIIRAFGNTVQINLTKPKRISAIIEGRDEALAFLRKAVKEDE